MDKGLNRRLDDLIAQSFGEALGRGRVSRVGAGLRSWSATSRAGKEAAISTAANVAFTAGMTAVLVAAGVAASVATLGIAPIAAAVGALAAFGASKLYTVAKRASRATEILDRLAKGMDTETGSFAIEWKKTKPTDLAEETVDLAEKIFTKLVDDMLKLQKELDAFVEAAAKDVRLKSQALTQRTAIPFLLGVEGRAHQAGQRHRDPATGLSIHPLRTRSGEIEPAGEKSLHRLRRIRFYLRWIADYMALLEGHAYDAVASAKEAETVLVAQAAVQVSMSGNHGGCSDGECFRATVHDQDLAPNISAVHTVAGPARAGAHVFGATSGVHSVIVGKSEMELRGYVDSAKGAAVNKVVGSALQGGSEAAAKAAGSAVTKAVGQVAGTAATAGVGALIGDAITFGVAEAYKRFTVTRPLQDRVRSVQAAMRKYDAGQLDEEVMAKAKENDITAVLSSFLLANSHYPKRVDERREKLQGLLRELSQNPSRTPSPFSNCRHAADGFRYLAKVYHQSEKLAVHCYFVRFCLKAIEEKVFEESYRDLLKPAMADIAALEDEIKARSKLQHTKTKVVDPLAAERAAGRAAAAQRADAQRAADAVAAVQRQDSADETAYAFKRAFDDANYALRTTGINMKAFADGRWRQSPQYGQSDTKTLTLAEWKDVSSIMLLPRSEATKKVDEALASFLGYLGPALQRSRTQPRPINEESAVALLADLQQRSQMLRPLVRTLDEWLNAKKDNAKSNRRPAIAQLHRLVAGELEDCVRPAAQLRAVMNNPAVR